MRKGRWDKEYYLFVIPLDWPMVDLTQQILVQLERMDRKIVKADAIPTKEPLDFETVLFCYQILPDNRYLYVIKTQTGWVPKESSYLFHPAYGYLITPISEESGDNEMVTKVVGTILMRYEIYRFKHGLPITTSEDFIIGTMLNYPDR